MSTPKAYATLWVGLSGRKDEKAHWKSLVHDREGRLDPWFGDEVELPRFDDATWARAWLLSHPGERAVVEVEAAKQIFGEDRAYAESALASPG